MRIFRGYGVNLIGFVAVAGLMVVLGGCNQDTGETAAPTEEDGGVSLDDDAPVGDAPVGDAPEVDIDETVEEAVENVVEDASGEGGGSPEASGPAVGEALKDVLADVEPDGWKRPGEVEQYTVDDLYVKINGRSELYMSYNVDTLTFETLVSESDNSKFIDVYVYDMQAPTGAFGVFSVERGLGVDELDVGREGYIDGASIFFWKGRYYVCVVPTEHDESIKEATTTVAKQIDQKLVDSGEPVKGLANVPRENIVPGSIQFFLMDAMSLDFMTDTFLAKYQKGDDVVVGFVSEKESETAAEETVSSYVEYLEKYGESVERADNDGVEMVIGDMGGVFDVVFHTGVFVGGVSSVMDKDLAQETARDLWEALQ